MGRALHARGKTRKAVTAFRTAVDITPDDPNAYVGLGLVLLDEGYTEDALISLKTAVELGGATDPPTNHKLGIAFAGLRQFPFAAQAFRWYSPFMFKPFPTFQNSISPFLPKLNLSYLCRCVQQNPRHIEAWFELAAALRKVHTFLLIT